MFSCVYKIGIEEKDVKKNKARNSFLRILELMIWAIFGAIIALMAVSGLPVINKGIKYVIKGIPQINITAEIVQKTPQEM